MRLTIVVAMSKDRVIGANGGMPWHLPADLAHFKEVTLGHPMVMGRKTFESIGGALPGRTTIVITGQTDWRADGVLVATDLDDAFAQALALDDEVFLVGGGQVYAQALERGVVDRLIITHIDADADGDTFFAPIDSAAWSETARETFNGFDIATYERIDTHGR